MSLKGENGLLHRCYHACLWNKQFFNLKLMFWLYLLFVSSVLFCLLLMELKASEDESRRMIAEPESSVDDFRLWRERIADLKASEDESRQRIAELEASVDESRRRIAELEALELFCQSRSLLNQLEASEDDFFPRPMMIVILKVSVDKSHRRIPKLKASEDDFFSRPITIVILKVSEDDFFSRPITIVILKVSEDESRRRIAELEASEDDFFPRPMMIVILIVSAASDWPKDQGRKPTSQGTTTCHWGLAGLQSDWLP